MGAVGSLGARISGFFLWHFGGLVGGTSGPWEVISGPVYLGAFYVNFGHFGGALPVLFWVFFRFFFAAF